MKLHYIARKLPLLLLSLGCISVYAAEVTYDGVSGGHWNTGTNWSSGVFPATSDIALLDAVASLDIAAPNSIQGIRVGTLGSGTLHVTFSGSLNATTSTGTGSYIGSGSGNQGTVEQTNGDMTLNELEIGRSSSTGVYNLNRGSLQISRRLQENSIYLGTDAGKTTAGLGTLSITAGFLTTRGGVYLGSTAGGIGIFEVQGSDSAEIGIGSYATIDGSWTQHAGSVLRVKIDRTSQGVTPILIDDPENDGTGGDVLFENGALLDVDFLANFVNGGTFTVMEWDGILTDNGLQFASSVDTNIWSFNVDTNNNQLTVTAAGDPYARQFVHPGSRHKLSDLERMRDMVAAGVEPWASAFANLEASGQVKLVYTPTNADGSLTTLTSTSVLRVEAMIAYHNSLMWNITGDERYAEVAVDILNSYSYITSINGLTPLSIGQACCHLVEAAEIIKHTYTGWDTVDMQRFSDMLVYPGYSNTTEPTGDVTFYWKLKNGDPARAGNQGLFSMRSMLAMGVFLDNERIYDRAVRYMRGATNRADDLAYPTGPPINGDPAATHDYAIQWGQSGRETTIADYGYNEVIANYVWESGQNEESSRDQAHGAVGLINMHVACEQAWNQGDDLYGHLDNRLLLGWEFLNRYNLSYLTSFPDQTSPWEPTIESGEYLQRLARTGRRFSLKVNPHIDGNTNSWTRGEPSKYPNFEIIMGHYRDRMGLSGDAIKWSERGHNYFQATYGPEVLGPASTYSASNWGGLKYRRITPGDPVQSFINGKPLFALNSLPATIEAENYDYFALDGEGRTYHDLSIGNSGGEYRTSEDVDISTCSEGGYALSSIESGEWITYTISVPSSSRYDFSIRYASSTAGGKIKFSFDGTDKTGEVTVPGGSGVWQDLTVATGVSLDQGVQQLKISFNGVSEAFQLNHFSITKQAVLPVGHWTFDDGNGAVATDSSGNGYDGNVANAVWTNGAEDGALEFNGTSAKVTIPGAAFSSISNQVTVAFWAYGDDSLPSDNSAFYAVKSGGGRILNVHLPYGNTNVYWDAGDTGYDRIQKSASVSEIKGSWVHWTFTKDADAGTMKIYRNAELWHSGTGRTRTMTSIISGTVGGQPSGPYYTGAIDDVRLYDVALSADDVQGLYESYSLAKVGEFAGNQDVGSPSHAGSASYSSGIYTVTGGGNDIYNNADNFHFVFSNHSGDGEIAAQVTFVENTDTWAKAGVMFRETSDAGSKEVMVAVRPDNQVTM
ncbi:carbohydrate-binding protein, partial [Pontiellaceae bacterium B12227]|nr:carbohydrate-binding protein [Pontiellaceae bacterium B12227]